jgi:indolepyruvate ferredoxin oxidoreductase beta subunit
MQRDIILAGVGGQGILTIAAVIGQSAIQQGLYLKQAEVHGMSQRGGDVQSNLRLSSTPIYSDLISRGAAELVIALEPMEGLRYAGWLSKEGWLITNETPYINIPNYPAKEQLLQSISLLPRKVVLDAEQLAKELGSVKAANMVVLGAAIPFLGLEQETIEEGVRQLFARKGTALVNLNLKAIQAGLAVARQNL